MNYQSTLLLACCLAPCVTWSQANDFLIFSKSTPSKTTQITATQNGFPLPVAKTFSMTAAQIVVTNRATDEFTTVSLRTVGSKKYYSIQAADPTDLNTLTVSAPTRALRMPYPKSVYPYLILANSAAASNENPLGDYEQVSGLTKLISFPLSQ